MLSFTNCCHSLLAASV